MLQHTGGRCTIALVSLWCCIIYEHDIHTSCQWNCRSSILSESMAASRSDIFASTVSFVILIASNTAHFVAQYMLEESGCDDRNWPCNQSDLVFSKIAKILTKVTSASP